MQIGDYEILIQWLMLFAVLSMIVTPAIIFWDVGRRSKKRGWVYFSIGLGVGLLTLGLGSLTARLLKHFEIVPRANEQIALLVIVAMPTIVVTTATALFRRNMEKKHQSGKPKFGSGKGMFVMKPDFDDPIEDFKDYKR